MDMLNSLNVSSEVSAAAVQSIEDNLTWQTSKGANDIKRRFSKALSSTTPLVSTTTEPNNFTESTADGTQPEDTTQSGNNLMFSGFTLLLWLSARLL